MNQERHENERLQDQDLASYTDALLDGQGEERERPALADTVELLARTLSPQPPPGELQRQVQRRVTHEWARHHGARRQRPFRLNRPARRLAMAAAAAMVVLAVTAIFLLPSNTGTLSGTASGGTTTTLVIVGLALTGGVVAWFVLRLQRRK